jgi:hypothetical protein
MGLHTPITALNLETNKLDSTEIPMSKPAIPGEWRSLNLLPRPRKILISNAAKGEMAMSAAVFLGVGGFFLNSYWHQFPTLVQRPKDALFVLLWSGLLVYFEVTAIREWFIARDILRDGDLAAGVLTDWREGRGGVSVSYQFWTDSGQRFERHGKVVSKQELANEREPLKVFYLPQDPTKSMALCCTSLQIMPNKSDHP